MTTLGPPFDHFRERQKPKFVIPRGKWGVAQELLLAEGEGLGLGPVWFDTSGPSGDNRAGTNIVASCHLLVDGMGRACIVGDAVVLQQLLASNHPRHPQVGIAAEQRAKGTTANAID